MKLSYLLVLVLLSFSLAGCGGSSGGAAPNSTAIPIDDDINNSGNANNNATNLSTTTFLPLSVFMGSGSKDFSGDLVENVFRGAGEYPFIERYLINPVDSESLSHVDDATISDFVITENDIPIDESESFPILQKVLNNTIFHDIALVVDISGSMHTADFPALIREIKAYVSSYKASNSDVELADVRFIVWAFATDVKQYSSLTSNVSEIEDALDEILSDKTTSELGGFSNLYRAVIESIGGYVGNGPSDRAFEPPAGFEYAFNFRGDRDPSWPCAYGVASVYERRSGFDWCEVNLINRSTADGINMSAVFLFSSGPDTLVDFDAQLLNDGIKWQSLVVIEEDSGNEDEDEEEKTPALAGYENSVGLPLPVFYVTPTPQDVDPNLETLAEEVITFNPLSSNYSFASQIKSAHDDAVDARINLDEQYLVRFASPKRQGKHTQIFESNTGGYNLGLTTEFEFEIPATEQSPELESLSGDSDVSLVEITTQENAYLSAQRANIANITKYFPATRWTNTTYGANDYIWELNRVDDTSWNTNGTLLNKNSDGSVSLSQNQTGYLRLTNTAISQSAIIQIYSD